jgi:hypothetical protein
MSSRLRAERIAAIAPPKIAAPRITTCPSDFARSYASVQWVDEMVISGHGASAVP